MLAAKADVLVIGPQNHLLALLEDLAIGVEPGVEGRLLAAPADGLDFLDSLLGFDGSCEFERNGDVTVLFLPESLYPVLLLWCLLL